MKTVFTSDLHWHHKNIVSFTNRGNDTTQENHTEWLINLWNTEVNPEDTVYHLGDFCFSTKYEVVAGIVRRLNGNKKFIKGNHCDMKIMQRLVQDGLIDSFKDYCEIKLGENKTATCLFHFPIACWHKQGHGSWHLSGHSHGNYNPENGFYLDVGLDSAWNIYGEHKFFSEENVVEYMQGRKIEVLDHHKKFVN